MIIKTVTTTEGLNTIVFDDFYKYFWVKNKGDAPVNVSAYCTCAAGSDNTVEISPNDSVLLENGDDDCVYVTGASVVEVHAQNFPDCPFKFAPAGGGGGAVQMTTTVLCDSTSSNSAITFSESADNYDLIIGTVTKSDSSNGLDYHYVENVIWSTKAFGTLSILMPCSKDGGSYVLSMSKANVCVYQSGYTSRRQSITAKLYGVKFSNS